METPHGSDLVGLAAPDAIAAPPRAAPLPAPAPAAAALPRARRRFARTLGWWLGGAAAAAVGAWVLVQSFRPAVPTPVAGGFGVHEFVTGPADVTTVHLVDGTLVRLGPQSRLQLSGAAGRREVTLEGRAFFAVAKRDGEPFVVKSRGGDAVVLGTRFEAVAEGDELQLLVVEGRVALESGTGGVELEAGQMARSVGGVISQPVQVGDVPPLLAWAGDFLVFQETPIEEVAVRLEEHFGVDVEVHGSAAGHTVTAWFGEPTLDETMRVICQVLGARCTVGDGRATIQIDRDAIAQPTSGP